MTEGLSKQMLLNIIGSELEDVIIGAFEGGINYWCGLDNSTPEFEAYKDTELAISEKVWKILLDGDTVYLYDLEDDEEGFELTLDKLLEGLNHYGNFDFDSMDAETYDAIIQHSLFGEWVYG